MPGRISRPPFDPELEAALVVIHERLPATVTREMLPQLRRLTELEGTSFRAQDAGLVQRDVTIPGYRGDDVVVSVIARPDHNGLGPGIYHIHGGGMITGNRSMGLAVAAPWIREHDAVLVTVEYRLAPEFPDPYPVEDSYAGLLWMAEHAVELGIDRERILVAGASAGGGLAAGVALLARDRQGPELIGQMLQCPMIDDRNDTASAEQIVGAGIWDRTTNIMAWTALLGERRGTDNVSIYAAPARATDLSGLPPAFIDCGSAEVFRDEDAAYASALWAAGGQAELHVWPGGFHGFADLAPHAALSQKAAEARTAWIDRLLGDS
ncbi:alpha/beta hydrolase [Nocardia nova]|uniref:alpha/beta hydrolase n=1 Tax=Nocardia nova TaxID=37330 RepID=UPI0033FB41AF